MKKLFSSLLLIVFVFASCSSGTTQSAAQTSPAVVDTKEVVLDNIMSRRSIRSYKPDQVEKAKIDTILLAGINAPSANNKQSWEVRVIQNTELLGKIKALNENIFHNSPTVIIVARDTANAFGDFDSALLTQNMLLTAHSMGLGTCSLGGLARLINSPEGKEIREALKLPEGYETILGISLGYPNESPDAKPRDMSKVQYID